MIFKSENCDRMLWGEWKRARYYKTQIQGQWDI